MIRWLIALFVAAGLSAAGLWLALANLPARAPEPASDTAGAETAPTVAVAAKSAEHGVSIPPDVPSEAPALPRIGGLAPSPLDGPQQKASTQKLVRQGPRAGEIVPATVRNVTPQWVTNRSVSVAELERVPGRVVPEYEPKRQPVTRSTIRTMVLDAGRMRTGKITVELSDVVALPFTAFCVDPIGGADWPCGRHARGDLRRLVGSRTIACSPSEAAPEPEIATLKVDVGPKPAPTTAPSRPAGRYQAGGTSLTNSRASYNAPARANGPNDLPQRAVPPVPGVDIGSDLPLAARVGRQLPPERRLNGRDAIIRIRSKSAHCQVGDTALGPWLTERGWAVPAAHRAGEQVYAEALAKARADRAGIWRDPVGAWCEGPCRANPTQTLDASARAAAAEDAPATDDPVEDPALRPVGELPPDFEAALSGDGSADTVIDGPRRADPSVLMSDSQNASEEPL